MNKSDILTKPITSNETNKLVVFWAATVLWIFMLIIVTITSIKTGDTKFISVLIGILTVQLLAGYSYTEYRVASLKKELQQKQQEITFTLEAIQQAKKL